MIWRRFGRHLRQGLVYLFALIGFVLVLGWLGLRLGWTKTSGIIDLNDRYFQEVTETIREDGKNKGQNIAQIIAEYNERHQAPQLISAWQKAPEWQVLKEALVKDRDPINRAAEVSGISPRLIVSILIVEQLRLYSSEREFYKQFFQPLKILGVQSQFSWGVTGLKEETAKQIETNLKDPNSVFYLGLEKENLLDFETSDHSAERFSRLTNSRDHYYSYLYTALYLRELMAQWDRAGYNISDRPEILATLFNLGFTKSKPKPDPQVGGAEIEIAGQEYSFGGLAYQFYYSNELITEFNWQ